MLQEHELIPYTTSPLPEGPWLIFAPHPDDETFGMGGSILLAAQQGIPVHLAFLTDGALGGETDQGSLTAVREAEARQAGAALGASSVEFLREPDRGLRVNQQTLAKVTEVIDKVAPASVFFPGLMEFHPDHRVTARLVWQALDTMGSSATAFSYEISTRGAANLLIDISEVAERKYEIVKIYTSQQTEAKYLALTKALDITRTFTLPIDRTAAEGYFKFANNGIGLEAQFKASIAAYLQHQTFP